MEHVSRLLVLGIILVIASCSAPKGSFDTAYQANTWESVCSDWDDWDKPAPPFNVFGNTYYVGTCGIASILVTTDEGHILIDGTTARGATVVADNIEKLGFDLQDVNVLLHSHEHFDHVGGLNHLQQLTGAKLLASPEAKPVLSSGVTSKADPQAGTHQPFTPARVDGVIRDKQTVSVGDTTLRAHATPGHTLGALTWQWQACDQEECLQIVYADSLSPVSRDGYVFTNHPLLLHRYRKGIETLSQLECDILLAPHPSMAGMRTLLLERQNLRAENACVQYADKTKKKVKKRLLNEQNTLAPQKSTP